MRYKKTDFNGFQGSFNAYCEWAESSEERMSWGDWWELLEVE